MLRRIPTVAILALLLSAGTATAQIPDEFKNLQVLPKDIGKRELVDLMRSFSGALGVRCTNCHPGPTPDSLEGVDFASDELEDKKVARGMIKMVDEINGKLLPATGKRSPLRVRCVTCHRGVTEPEPLGDLLVRTAEKGGTAAAVARYQELRKEYYGTGSYDFSARTLNGVAEKLAQEKHDVDGAITLAQLNVEQYPDTGSVHLLLGQLYAQKGDKAAARASVERALALDPGDRRAKQLLERLAAPE